MVESLIIIALAFAWLMVETDWLTIRLESYNYQLANVKPPKYARYVAYNSLKGKSGTWLKVGNNYPPNYSPNGEPEYSVYLSPGVTDVLCGWDWLDQHCASMVDYEPIVKMTIANVRYSMQIRDLSVIKDIMKVNHLTKKQIQALV